MVKTEFVYRVISEMEIETMKIEAIKTCNKLNGE